MLDAGRWMLDAGCWVRAEKAGTEGKKRGNYGSPYFGGGGFCSFEKGSVD